MATFALPTGPATNTLAPLDLIDKTITPGHRVLFDFTVPYTFGGVLPAANASLAVAGTTFANLVNGGLAATVSDEQNGGTYSNFNLNFNGGLSASGTAARGLSTEIMLGTDSKIVPGGTGNYLWFLWSKAAAGGNGQNYGLCSYNANTAGQWNGVVAPDSTDGSVVFRAWNYQWTGVQATTQVALYESVASLGAPSIQNLNSAYGLTTYTVPSTSATAAQLLAGNAGNTQATVTLYRVGLVDLTATGGITLAQILAAEWAQSYGRFS